MRAVRLTGVREIEIADIAPPVIKNDCDVLVDVHTVGICGSDVHNYLEGGIGARKVDYPFIPGHEASGRVAAVGDAVTRVKAGDRIMIEPAFHCGECDQCRKGRFNTCRNIQFMSSAGELQGCMCEQVVIPQQNCFVIPDGLSYEQAAVAEPLSIALYSVKAFSVPLSDGPVAVLGSGPVGLCTMLAAKAMGADQVYVSDRIDERLKLAGKLGATAVANPDSGDVVQDFMAAQPLGFSAVFECSGDALALEHAVNLLAPGGVLLLTGIPVGSRISLNIDQLRRKEIRIQNVRRQNSMVEDTIKLLDSGAVDVRPLVTHRFGLDEAGTAFELVAAYSDGVVKAMVRCQHD